MNDKQYKLYDFKQASSLGDSAVSFRSWIAKSAQALFGHWARYSNSETNLVSTDFLTQTYGTAMETIQKSSVGCVFNLGKSENTSLWHVNQKDMHAIVADMLNVPVDAELPDRPLTQIELTLGQCIFNILGRSVGEGWLGQSPISCEVEESCLNPERLRLCRESDLVLTSRLAMTLPRGEVSIHWISPQKELSSQLEAVPERRTLLNSESDPEVIIKQLPIEIIGLLGQANISMRRLAELSVGDVVVLNQKIDRPIIAWVDGKPIFEGWPGKIGDMQAMEIATCLT